VPEWLHLARPLLKDAANQGSLSKMRSFIFGAVGAGLLGTSAFAGPVSYVATKAPGVSLRDYIAATGFASTPPDMGGAVSQDHVVQLTNGGIAIFNKQGQRLSYQTNESFLTAAGIAPADIGSSGAFDPRLVYDTSTQRYIGVFEATGPAGSGGAFAPPTGRDFPKLGDAGEGDEINETRRAALQGESATADATSSTPNNPIYVFVSKTSNPLDGFRAVKFNTTQGYFGDFPTLGVTGDAVTITTNDFSDAGFQSVSLFTIPKADLLGATPTLARLTRNEGLDPNSYGFALQPVTNPNATGSQNVIAISAANFFEQNLSKLNLDANGVQTTLDSPSILAIARDGDPAAGRQPFAQTRVKVDTGDDRIGSSVHQAGNYIFVTHGWGDDSFTGRASTYSAIAYEIIDARTNTVVAQGQLASTARDYSFPSIAPNSDGSRFALTYTRSGPNETLSNYAVVCNFNQATLAVKCGPQVLVQVGLDPGYVLTLGGSRNRWGDYSQIQWDEFTNSWWVFGQYSDYSRDGFNSSTFLNSGRWATIVAQIAVPSPAMVALFGLGAAGLGFARRRRAA
jgi:hypothetical protein